MIQVSEARRIILENSHVGGVEVVSLTDCLGRVLARSVHASRDVPPTNNSAMDGFALTAVQAAGASKSAPVFIPVSRTIRAGDWPGAAVNSNRAVKIMTGAPIPDGVDTVVRVEDTSFKDGCLVLCNPPRVGGNIRAAGEDIAAGSDILEAGRCIGPVDMGLVASQGIAQLTVYRRPTVAIIATGDEVVNLGEVPREAQIFSSNSYSLMGLVRECGAIPRLLGISRDDPVQLAEMIREGFTSDVVVTSGGVSMGDYDYLKEVLEEIGARVLFSRVAQKPGKPMTFGVMGWKPIFALPGNPVSAALSFELYARPSIRKMMGHTRLFRPTVKATMEQDIRKKKGRRNFIRGIVERRDGIFYARTTGAQGSGILRSMSLANGIIVLPEDTDGVDAGQQVDVYLLNSDDALLTGGV